MNPKIPNFDLAKVLSPGMIQDTAACVVGSVHDPSFLHYNIMNFIYFHLEEHISIQDCKKKMITF
jgi:hypothetical protein